MRSLRGCTEVENTLMASVLKLADVVESLAEGMEPRQDQHRRVTAARKLLEEVRGQIEATKRAHPEDEVKPFDEVPEEEVRTFDELRLMKPEEIVQYKSVDPKRNPPQATGL
jgi:hypothetical protein